MDSAEDKLKLLALRVKANPDDSFLKFALALEFLKHDKTTQARILFENIYANDPDYVGVYYHLGKLYERLDRLSDAKAKYREGLAVAERQKERQTYKELKEALAQLKIELEEQQEL